MTRCSVFLSVIGLLLLQHVNQIDSLAINDEEKASPLNIAIIGAGASGLASARHAIAQGHDVTVYEQGEELGGIWAYTEQIGTDKYGLKIHTAMYKDLRTNLPYQLMEFPDFHHGNGTISFPPQIQILKFLQAYADHYDVKSHINFRHLVVRALPIENDKWEVIVKDLPNNKFITKVYDAVFVCNGHFFASRTPELDGANEFKGKVIHSHDFRTSETFRGDNVLIIGAGSSGLDLVIQLSKIAKQVTLSQKKPAHETKEARDKRENSLPPKTILKDNIKRFTPGGAIFVDGTELKFTAVIYATGYKYSYPFLSVDSGISIDENFIQPLYKQILNIEHPTMAFIGIPSSAINFFMFDMQARFALKLLSGGKKIPSKPEMLTDMRVQTQIHWAKGFTKSKTHYLGVEQRDYYKQLSEAADIENYPDVLSAMHFDASYSLKNTPTQFRTFKYNIVDDKSYTKFKYTDNIYT